MIELANVAGGMEVQRLGAVPVTRDELLQELSFRRRDSHSKLMTLPKLLDELAARRESGARIVMTNGCFDLMHPGHVASLALARSYGDCLVVGLNSDVSVRALKGEGRPLIDELGRAEMLSALESVDHIVLFDEVSVTPLIEQVRPEVLVKSNQYDVEGVVGHEVVQSYGGRIVLTPMKGDYSTSGLIEKIRQTPEQTASGPLDGNP
jgi:D-beta-D-heptose 7-phosphate kinase/D-beta-D-heptose 1-phosphate adenosyltransferase